MTDHNFELTRDQQEILLQGLRYVRSSVALDMAEYTDEVDAERRRKYARISELETILKGVAVSEGAPA
jgi:hypothetical protein